MADSISSSDSIPLPLLPHACPRCGSPIPPEEGFISWCEQCDWNVQPDSTAKPHGRLDALYVESGRRFGQSLFDEINASTRLQPTRSIARVAGLLLALGIHALTLLALIAGIALVISGVASCLSLFGGLALIGLAWALRPRPIALPDEAKVTPRQEAPRLYALVDQVAAALKTKSIDGLIVDADFNAGLSLIGWQRKRILFVGLPLFLIAEPSERVALIAHELAHSVNGDPMRGLVVGSALNTLVHWLGLLRPDPMMSQRYGLPGLFANAVMSTLSVVIWLVAAGLTHLLFRDAQRAEYLADQLAAQISSTAAMLALLEKMHLRDTFQASWRRAALSQVPLDFFGVFHERIRRLPPRELERIRRAEKLEGSRLDMTHPPTVFRLATLENHPVKAPQLILDAAGSAAIDQELAKFQPKIGRELIRRYEASLYD